VVSTTGKSVIGRPRESSGPQFRPAFELVLCTDFSCSQARNSLESSFPSYDIVQIAYLRYLYKTRVAEDTSEVLMTHQVLLKALQRAVEVLCMNEHTCYVCMYR